MDFLTQFDTEAAGRGAEERVAALLEAAGVEVFRGARLDANDKHGVDLIAIDPCGTQPVQIQVKRSANEAKRFRTKHRNHAHYRRILVAHTRSYNGQDVSDASILEQLARQFESLMKTGFAW